MNMPEIIYEDNDIIICHKPAGIAVQTRRVGQTDMENELKNYRTSKGEEPYIGVIHRLDQPVEGLIVFAKNQASAASLSKQVSARDFSKYYYALVRIAEEIPGGEIKHEEPEWITLVDYMVKNGKTNTSCITSESAPGAKRAVLDYHVIKRGNGVALLDIHLHTGRHHQIRVQMAHAGMPLVGDRKYGPGRDEDAAKTQKTVGIDNNGQNCGIALCAYRLEFTHPSSGEKVSFQITPKWAEYF